MYSQKWRIGIDLYLNKIQLVAAKKQRNRWCLCECWQQQIPENTSETLNSSEPIILERILTKWRQKLPKSCEVQLALPVLRTIKHQFILSEHLSIKEPEINWYVQSRAKKQFPINADELIFDYRIIDQNVYLSGARKSDILFWSDLLKKSGFLLTAIDVSPCALRYAARQAGLPDESWILHYRSGEWLWVGPVSQPACYNQLTGAEAITFSEVLTLLSPDPSVSLLPIYYIGNRKEPLATHHWHILQSFYRHTLKLPHQLGDFVIAAGLIFRQDEN